MNLKEIREEYVEEVKRMNKYYNYIITSNCKEKKERKSNTHTKKKKKNKPKINKVVIIYFQPFLEYKMEAPTSVPMQEVVQNLCKLNCSPKDDPCKKKIYF